jgi:hypothetical protein
MFEELHLDINTPKTGLLHCKKSRQKVKDGIINSILRKYLVDRYTLPISGHEVCQPIAAEEQGREATDAARDERKSFRTMFKR